jgi:hypothetical protein
MQDRRWSAFSYHLIKPTPVKDVERRADPELSVTISDLMPPVEQGWMIAARDALVKQPISHLLCVRCHLRSYSNIVGAAHLHIETSWRTVSKRGSSRIAARLWRALVVDADPGQVLLAWPFSASPSAPL